MILGDWIWIRGGSEYLELTYTIPWPILFPDQHDQRVPKECLQEMKAEIKNGVVEKPIWDYLCDTLEIGSERKGRLTKWSATELRMG